MFMRNRPRQPVARDLTPEPRSTRALPGAHDAVEDKGVCGDEFLGRRAAGEDAHRSLPGVRKRAGHKQHAPGVEFSQPRNVGLEMGGGLGQPIRSGLILNPSPLTGEGG